MKFPVCCMRDQLTGFMNPFVVTNTAVAERDFRILVNDKEQKMYFEPSHFDLYKIGEFDNELGALLPCEPEILCTGLSVFKGE